MPLAPKSELLTKHEFARSIDAVDMQNMLGEIKANDGRLRLDDSAPVLPGNDFGTLMPLE